MNFDGRQVELESRAQAYSLTEKVTYGAEKKFY